MTIGDTLPWISLAVSIGTPLAIFAGRNWLKAYIEKGVQHKFDRDLENMRAVFRESEARLNSRLRDREAEIATLRTTLLAGNSSRQSLLDKRRFEAVEKIWIATNEMAKLNFISGMVALLNVDAIAKELHDPRMKGLLAMVGTGAPAIADLPKNVARDERPFVSELAWAYFKAYSTVLHGNYMVFKMLEIGNEPAKYMKRHAAKDILKAALPHQSEWIDEVEPESYHHLLEELQENLLNELRKILDGADVSAVELEKSKRILDAVKRADEDQAQAVANTVHADGI